MLIPTRTAMLATVAAAIAGFTNTAAHADVSLVSSVEGDQTGYSFKPAKVVTFDSVLAKGGDFTSEGFLFSGTGSIVKGSHTGQYKTPTIDTSSYLSTGKGTETVSFGQTFKNLGFYWGSVDAFNTVTFSLAGIQVGSFSGNDIMDALNGSKSEYVNFSGAFDKIAFTSTRPSFEFDNLAVGDVPEPATWVMMILGLIGLTVVSRARVSARFGSRRVTC